MMRLAKLFSSLSKKSNTDGAKNCIQKSLRNCLLIAQIFGLMPVSGITKDKIEFLRFLWISFRTGYAILYIIGAVFMMVLQIIKMQIHEKSLGEYRLLVFYISGVSTGVNFLLLSRRWPMIMRKWNHLETSFVEYGLPKNLHKTINLFLTIFLSTALLEHFLEDIHKISLIHTCGLNFSNSVEMFLKHFILADAFTIVNYTLLWGILLEIISLLLTFSWTFIDIFIILISWCLSERFIQITQKVKLMVRTRVSDEKKWEKVRNDYIRLCQLCRLLDHELSFIILQSIASNMFFILAQLFNSFQFKAYVMEEVYFCFSFFTLILRMYFVCVVAGKISEESSKPLVILSEAPNAIYNTEIQRFADYIHWNNISLTGRRYFVITKGLLLNITGAVITYELVLLQFEGHTINPNDVNETSKYFNCESLLDA